MKDQPLRTSVVGSYPFPAWFEAAAGHLEKAVARQPESADLHTMRLFRQPARSDWDSVIARVRHELVALAAGDG